MRLHRANTHWGATTLLAPRLPDSSRYPFQVPNQHPRVWQTSSNIPKHPQTSPSIPKPPDTELPTTVLIYLATYVCITKCEEYRMPLIWTVARPA